MVDEVAYSFALGEVCCERCAPGLPLGAAGRQRPSKPFSAPPKPSAVARLTRRVLAALEASSVAVTGGESAVGGIGDGDRRFAGYCPVCLRGIATIAVIDTTPPELDLDDCTAGCAWQQIRDVL